MRFSLKPVAGQVGAGNQTSLVVLFGKTFEAVSHFSLRPKFLFFGASDFARAHWLSPIPHFPTEDKIYETLRHLKEIFRRFI